MTAATHSVVAPVLIYVSENGRDEVLFAESPGGSQDANWIEAGFVYEFRLLMRITVNSSRRWS